MQHCFLLSRKSLRFLGSAMGIAIANRKNRCDFGALRINFLWLSHSRGPQFGKCPVLPFLVFLEFLIFSPCEEFLVFLSVFPFFSRDCRGSVRSVGIKNPCFLGGFPGLCPKNKERKDRVFSSRKVFLGKTKGCEELKVPQSPKPRKIQSSKKVAQKWPWGSTPK